MNKERMLKAEFSVDPTPPEPKLNRRKLLGKALQKIGYSTASGGLFGSVYEYQHNPKNLDNANTKTGAAMVLGGIAVGEVGRHLSPDEEEKK